jgi:phosphatidylserine/phosphatidylglycerophosphate/cardiolipin synthase-like enzyme
MLPAVRPTSDNSVPGGHAPSRRAGPALLQPGRNCWRLARADRASVIVDADDYFAAARAAMLRAERQILLIGWDFDARVRLGTSDVDDAPLVLGEFILWLVKERPELDIYLLRWDLGALNVLFRGSTVWTLLRWMKHRRIHTKLDGAHPPGSSHHQKIVVIDDAIAFCGGIDMTGERWDTRDHADDEPRRRGPNGKPYGPWHDATTALEGPVAAALGDLARERWHAAGGRAIVPPTPRRKADLWPSQLTDQFRDLDVAVSRSIPPSKAHAPVREIEALYVDLIASARRFIYAESQYFASRRIAEAIGKRLGEDDPPEIVLINPFESTGWLEPLAMDTARARLVEALRRLDRHDRLRIYHPYTAGGRPIFVHAKVLIVDDRLLRIGSSNLNNRSLRLDSECDVTLEAGMASDAAAASESILAVRDGLLAEHLGQDPRVVREAIRSTDSMIRAIESLRSDGRSLRAYETPDLSSVEAWLAEHEVLDPEGPEEMFESFTRRGLLRRLSDWGRGLTAARSGQPEPDPPLAGPASGEGAQRRRSRQASTKRRHAASRSGSTARARRP